MRIITVQYYPSLNPNVYRWSAIAEKWAQQGHDIHLLCTRHSAAEEEEVRNGVHIHRAGHATLLDWAYNLMNIRERRGEVQSSNSKKSWSRQVLEKLVDWTWRTFYWPDGSCIWYMPAKRRALLLHKKHQFDAIISVSLPFTANLIAAALKKRFPTVQWLLDIEDPFSFSMEFWVNNVWLYKQLNFRAEARLLQLADNISVTVPSAKAYYQNYFPTLHLNNKIRVIPPLLNTDVKIEDQSITFSNDELHIAYFGTFYERVRTPDALLQILAFFLQQFPNYKGILKIHLFGAIPAKALSVFERYATLKNNLVFHGLVSRATVIAVMQQVDFLLNIGNTTAYHLPSKSAEYLQSGKPILNICQHPTDTFKDFMKDYPLILNIEMHDDYSLTQLANELDNFIRENKGKTVSEIVIEKLIAPYTLEKIAASYLQLLRKPEKE